MFTLMLYSFSQPLYHDFAQHIQTDIFAQHISTGS